jgi:hypothetical protein
VREQTLSHPCHEWHYSRSANSATTANFTNRLACDLRSVDLNAPVCPYTKCPPRAGPSGRSARACGLCRPIAPTSSLRESHIRGMICRAPALERLFLDRPSSDARCHIPSFLDPRANLAGRPRQRLGDPGFSCCSSVRRHLLPSQPKLVSLQTVPGADRVVVQEEDLPDHLAAHPVVRRVRAQPRRCAAEPARAKSVNSRRDSLSRTAGG